MSVALADDGPKPSPSPTPGIIQRFTPDQYAQAQAIAQATSLSVRIDAERALAASERAFVLVAAAAAAAAPAFQRALAWVWPVKGVVSQGFGRTSLGLEPPRTYHGVAYPNFHEGLDIAAPLGSPVLAAATGRLAFAGHLPDGAEVVLLAHEGGLFTLYAHLDDTVAPPPPTVGQTVQAGDLIGWNGLTGITTGPHLHFVIRRGDEPIEPSGLLPRS